MAKINVTDPGRYTVKGKPATRREYLDSVAAANLAELKKIAKAAEKKAADGPGETDAATDGE